MMAISKMKKKYLKGKDEFGYALGAICPNPSGYAEPMHRINIDDNRLWGFKRVEKL